MVYALCFVLLFDTAFACRVCSEPDRVRTMYQSFVLDFILMSLDTNLPPPARVIYYMHTFCLATVIPLHLVLLLSPCYSTSHQDWITLMSSAPTDCAGSTEWRFYVEQGRCSHVDQQLCSHVLITNDRSRYHARRARATPSGNNSYQAWRSAARFSQLAPAALARKQ